VDADALINAVAYTAVDQAESDAETAYLVNATSVGAMAEVAGERNIPLVHISTDYVFDGSGDQPWRPNDETGPLGVYGASKLAGEDAVRASGARHVILRTAWVFGAHGKNFVKTVLRLAAERERLTVVNDQFGGPTPAADIADACYTLARAMHGGAEGGTFHFAGAPWTNWAEFAREIFSQAGLPTIVDETTTEGYPTVATRPRNSRLDCTSLEAEFGIGRPDWRKRLGEVLAELQT
jgi:dTDP-4-dehydrorhamnose reductase